jgi:hypothetical protein
MIFLKNLLFTVVFAALWIGLIYKREGLYNWVFQYEDKMTSYMVIAIPIIIYALVLAITQFAKIKYLKKK